MVYEAYNNNMPKMHVPLKLRLRVMIMGGTDKMIPNKLAQISLQGAPIL